MATIEQEHRRSELVIALGALRVRLADACVAAGRPARTVTMIAVTKTHPAVDVATLVQLGIRDVGENRDQEAAVKRGEVQQLLTATAEAEQELRWHFVGRLQSRKCRSVAGYAHAVHSVDRIGLVALLANAVDLALRRPLEIFVQVSLDGDPARGGAFGSAVFSIADAVAERPELRLRGVMAVAPLGVEPQDAFARLAEVSTALSAQHPGADAISAGMSTDFEAAIGHGSTHVRIGSALLGRRTPEFR